MKTKLTKFMKGYTKKEKVLFFDMHNLLFRSLFVSHGQDPLDKTYGYFKFLVMNGIFKNIKNFQPTKVIIASDSRNYWRRDIYPGYKASRKGMRDKSGIDFDHFFGVYDKFMEDLKEALTMIHFLAVHRCEADDIIAVLTKERFQKDDVVNYSTDKDMYQLFKYKNYTQFDPIKKKFITHLNPARELVLKILTGDRGDDIPGVKSKCGPVTAQQMLDLGLTNSLLNKSMEDNFERNKQLIDFDMIPLEIVEKITSEFDNYHINTYNGGKIFNFLVKYKLNFFIENLQEFTPSLKEIG